MKLILMGEKSVFGLFISFVLATLGCGSPSSEQPERETTTRGTIRISVDESFRPVIDSQVKVFESLHPDAHILVEYKPEAECLRDLNNDSVRMVIVTKGLDREQQRIMKERLSFNPAFDVIAFDAVALITNRNSPDTVFTMEEVRSMVRGTSEYPYKVLLDGLTQTSTVRFVIDSILRGEPLSKNVVAAQGSEAVIDYVAANNDAVGLIGVSWVGNPNDPQVLSFLERVHIAAIECTGCSGTYVKPYQANIYGGRYPMVRPLFYILKENYRGLGSGFRNFLIYEKGQLVFQRAYLLPAKMQFEVREMMISDSELE